MTAASESRSQYLFITIVTLFLLSFVIIDSSKYDYSLPSIALINEKYEENKRRNEISYITPKGNTQFLLNNETAVTNETTILCLVMTRVNGEAMQNAIVDTWGQGCTDLIFLIGVKTADNNMLIELKPHIYTLILAVEDAWSNTWMKIRTALKHIRNNWKHSFDWLLRIDDDAFVIFDNLRKFLSTLDPTVPVQLGAHYLHYAGGYIGTGPGIAISRAGFENLMAAFDNHSLCNTNATTHADDVELGNCLKNANVPFGNSSDSLGRPRFIPISLNDLLVDPNAPNHGFFETESAYPVKEGLDCCSDDLISLHYVTADVIHRLHLIVQANPDKQKNLRLLTANWMTVKL